MRYHCLVVSPDGTSVWLVPDAYGWSLPSAECEAGWLANAAGALQEQLRARYGLEAVVLREILRGDNHDTSVCEVEALGFASAAACRGEWHLASAAAVSLRRSGHYPAVARWCANAGVERHIAPWQRRGWFAVAQQWIDSAVRAAGLEVSGIVTQIKAGWNGSSVLKVPTTGGVLYFKASPPRMPGESAVVRVLQRRWPRHVPELIASDQEQCWMLVREADGAVLDPGDRHGSAEAVRLYARIQIDQAAGADSWCSIGCPDRGLAAMERDVPTLLVEVPDRLAGAGVITLAERDEIASFVPDAIGLCHALVRFAIPPRSIHHEDFRSGNVLRRRDGTLVILDWNETVVAHPFFSAQRYLWFILPPHGAARHEILATDADALRRAVRDAYLEPFERFEPRGRLLEAFRLSSLLAPIYDALRFCAGADLHTIFARGLVAEERRIARNLMDHLLEVKRAAVPVSRRARWQWPWTRRGITDAPWPARVRNAVTQPLPVQRKLTP